MEVEKPEEANGNQELQSIVAGIARQQAQQPRVCVAVGARGSEPKLGSSHPRAGLQLWRVASLARAQAARAQGATAMAADATLHLLCGEDKGLSSFGPSKF